MAKVIPNLDETLVLEAALEGLEIQKKRIEGQILEIRSRLRKRSRTSKETPLAARKRNLSPESRKRIAAAQKKRWAEYRKANVGSK